MIRLPRRLLIWGGAAAVAGGGFAFMAGSTVGYSSAGEGAQSVSGYTVSNVSYNGYTDSCSATQTCIDGVSFTLTANTIQPGATNQPTSITVLYESGSTPLNASVLNATTPVTPAPGACKITGWSTVTGSGTVNCSTGNVGEASVTNIDVSANE